MDLPGTLVHVGAVIMCPHAGPVEAITTNMRVLVSGQPVVTISDVFTVEGCPFQIPLGLGTKPQPCIRVQWLVPALKVLINGEPAILDTSPGLCFSIEEIPQGPPIVEITQLRVEGL